MILLILLMGDTGFSDLRDDIFARGDKENSRSLFLLYYLCKVLFLISSLVAELDLAIDPQFQLSDQDEETFRFLFVPRSQIFNRFRIDPDSVLTAHQHVDLWFTELKTDETTHVTRDFSSACLFANSSLPPHPLQIHP